MSKSMTNPSMSAPYCSQLLFGYREDGCGCHTQKYGDLRIIIHISSYFWRSTVSKSMTNSSMSAPSCSQLLFRYREDRCDCHTQKYGGLHINFYISSYFWRSTVSKSMTNPSMSAP